VEDVFAVACEIGDQIFTAFLVFHVDFGGPEIAVDGLDEDLDDVWVYFSKGLQESVLEVLFVEVGGFLEADCE
jgi:hypothetical protein